MGIRTCGIGVRPGHLQVMTRRSLLAGASLCMIAACAPGATQAPTPLPRSTPTAGVKPVAAVQSAADHARLPEDEAPHDNLTEWWYYTGHLAGAEARYGFELVMFQARRLNYPSAYAAHFAVTDHQRKQFQFDQRVGTDEQPQTAPGFDLRLGDWQLRGRNGDDGLKAMTSDRQYGIDLTLHATKPPALHHGTGLITFGDAGDSYYYSRTRMLLQGNVQDHGAEIPVTGMAWMDHQWGNFVVGGKGGWDWYSIQLADGTDIMLSIVRSAEGALVDPYGTVVGTQGDVLNLVPNDFTTQTTGTWTSPATGIAYPSGWTITVKPLQLTMTLTPVIPDQELAVKASTGQAYWEGEVTVVGSTPAGPVTGEGYVELTGYR